MGQDASLQRYGDGSFMRFGLSLGQSLVDMLGVELRALNTLASLFTKSSPSPQRDEYFDDFGPGDQQHSLSSNRRLSSLFEPRNSRNGKGFTHGPAKCSLGSPAHITPSQAPAHPDLASSGSDLDLTPPLTPDIANNESYSFDSLRSSAHSGLGDSYDDNSPPLHSPEVREGKKPERRIVSTSPHFPPWTCCLL